MNSGPTQFPQGPRLPGSAPQGNEPNARLIGVPNDLRDVRTPVKLPGRVVEANRDGSVKIETPRGTVDIVLPKNEIPREGSRVEIVIPPGRPPQQVTVRPAPEQNTSPSSGPQPSRPDAPAPQTPSRPAETPVNVQVPPTAQLLPPAALPFEPAPPQTAPLQPQDIIQLLPLAPKLEAEIFVPTPETVAAPVIDKAVFAAQLAVIEAGAEIIRQVLQTVQPAVPTTVTQNPSPLPQPQATQIPQAVTEFFPAQNNPIKNNPAPPAPGASKPETISFAPLAPPEILSVLPAAVIDIIPALLTGIKTPPAAPIPAQPIAAQILSITPPPVPLIAPGTKPPQTPLEVVKHFLEHAPEKIATPNIQNQNFIPAVKNTVQPQAVTTLITGTIAQLPVLSFFTPEGQIVQNFVLQPAAPGLIPGTSIQIVPLPAQAPSMPLPAGTPLPLSFLTPEPWPLLQQIYNVLVQTAPQAAQALGNMAPNAGNPAQLGPAALFFLAAVRGGDLTGWLGDKSIDALRRDPRGLLSRLTQEGSALSRLASDPVSQDWRGMSLPLYWQGEIHKMALYYKRDYSGGENDKDSGGQYRFLFDLSLSNMGKVQLDGLMRGKKLDLIVRTEQAFAQATQMQMRRAYTNALENSQLSGELSFQNKPEQWVYINKEGKEAYSADI